MILSWRTVRMLSEYGDEQASDYMEFVTHYALRITHYVSSYSGKLYLCSYAYGMPREWVEPGVGTGGEAAEGAG